MLTDLIECPHCDGKGCDRCHLGMVRLPAAASKSDVARLRTPRDFGFPLAFDNAEKATQTDYQRRKYARAKAKGTERRSVSFKGATYRRMREHCEARGKSVSGWLEELIAERLES